MLILNRKNILKIFILFLIALCILNIESLATIRPSTDFYVNDYANLLNKDTEDYIININKNLYSKTGAQVVVVTVKNLEGNSIEEYATELFREFGIGDKDKNNGVLLLLALEERQFRIEVGYGLEGELPDAKTGRIQDDYIIPYLKENNWNDGIRNGFNAIIKVIAEKYNVDVGEENVIVKQSKQNIMDIIEVGMYVAPFFSFLYGMILKHLFYSKKSSKKKRKKKKTLVHFFLSYI